MIWTAKSLATEGVPLRGKSVVTFRGIIDDASAERLEKLLGEGATTLNLVSDGGSVETGIKLARFIRDHGISTFVGKGNGCYSACLLLFQAGVPAIAHEDAVFMSHYASQTSLDNDLDRRARVWGTVSMLEVLIELGASAKIYQTTPPVGDLYFAGRDLGEIGFKARICRRNCPKLLKEKVGSPDIGRLRAPARSAMRAKREVLSE